MTIKNREYTTPEIAKIVDRTVHKTISYINRGYVSPSVQDASGHGSKRLWSYLDVVRVAFICYLEDYGLGVPKLREIGQEMSDKRMQTNCVWLIPPKGSEDIEVVANWELAEDERNYEFQKPFAPKMIALSPDSPVSIVGSMLYLHRWVEDRISKVGLT